MHSLLQPVSVQSRLERTFYPIQTRPAQTLFLHIHSLQNRGYGWTLMSPARHEPSKGLSVRSTGVFGCRTDLELVGDSRLALQVNGREKYTEMSLVLLLQQGESGLACGGGIVAQNLTVWASSFQPSHGSDFEAWSARRMSRGRELARGTHVYRVALTQPCFLDQRCRLLNDPFDFESLQNHRRELDSHAS